ncbi:hypothetical protein B0H14DRAFT_2581551 [Mycena olivaceomarginata]|nr:hypothetical protein B0H14DRAFT_2581551 [Mycena olivaceomarginata]
MDRIEAQNEEEKGSSLYPHLGCECKEALNGPRITVALAVEADAQQLDKDYLMSIDTILYVCAGLVIVDEQVSMVRLVHSTTQEYLNRIQAQRFPNVQTEITRTLLTFLA